MLTATRTVTINAAFLQEIKQDNIELRQLVASLAGLLIQPRPQRMQNWRQVAEDLGRLRDQLAMHFALEEAFGYFEDAVDVAPRLSTRAETLRAEHDRFFLHVCDLVELAERLLYHEQPPRQMAAVMQGFQQFHADFSRHEAQERELIMEAFDEDIGVGD